MDLVAINKIVLIVCLFVCLLACLRSLVHSLFSFFAFVFYSKHIQIHAELRGPSLLFLIYNYLHKLMLIYALWVIELSMRWRASILFFSVTSSRLSISLSLSHRLYFSFVMLFVCFHVHISFNHRLRSMWENDVLLLLH